jgi:hypothetical protein
MGLRQIQQDARSGDLRRAECIQSLVFHDRDQLAAAAALGFSDGRRSK